MDCAPGPLRASTWILPPSIGKPQARLVAGQEGAARTVLAHTQQVKGTAMHWMALPRTAMILGRMREADLCSLSNRDAVE